MNTFAKSFFVAAALAGFGATGAMAATTPAQCYAARSAANLQVYRAAVTVCNTTAGSQMGKLGDATVNALTKGPSSYTAFRAAVTALHVIAVPNAVPAELASTSGWSNYVKRVNAAAKKAVEDNFAVCTNTAEKAYLASNAAAKAACRA